MKGPKLSSKIRGRALRHAAARVLIGTDPREKETKRHYLPNSMLMRYDVRTES